jgi:hypothetical protein
MRVNSPLLLGEHQGSWVVLGFTLGSIAAPQVRGLGLAPTGRWTGNGSAAATLAR